MPAFVLGLYTRALHPKALLLGWLVAMPASTAMAAETAAGGGGISPNITLTLFGQRVTAFIALYGLAINLAVCVVASPLLWLVRADAGSDATRAADYA